jgi:thiamine-monophosphate kinase
MNRGIGELDLIDRIRKRAASGGHVAVGIGDDASVTSPAGQTVTTVDAIVEGVHFERAWSDARSITHKALATALSDVAAMAADPGEVYVTVGLPPDADRGFCFALADALVELATGWDVVLAGGDTVSSPTLFMAVTAVGHLPRDEAALTRSGARPGDVVAVTGRLGGAGAGLLLLGGRAAGATLPEPVRERLVGRQLRPDPLLAVGRSLRGLGVTALIDVSDGLGTDLAHIAMASGVAITVDAGLVPFEPGLAEVAAAAGRDPLELALGAGEDYELAMTLPADRFDEVSGVVGRAGVRLSVLGRVSDGEGVRLVSDGSPVPMPHGFEHRV